MRVSGHPLDIRTRRNVAPNINRCGMRMEKITKKNVWREFQNEKNKNLQRYRRQVTHAPVMSYKCLYQRRCKTHLNMEK
jgi:hypothetical protein